MKQNSSIMFHVARKTLKISLLSGFLLIASSVISASEDSSNPEEGFKPAQSSLTAIFRKLSGSLEHYGHPGPYLRHVKSEHERISAKYRDKLGKEMTSYLPEYMTNEYIEDLCKNWDELAPNLKLERLAKKSGRTMRLAIDGENGKGTSLVLLFNFHQNLVYEEMVSGEKRTIGFERLKAELLNLAETGESDFLARNETKLSDAERLTFRSLIEKPKFTKADFPILETFYDGPFDRLSEYGKALISERIYAGQSGKDVLPSDGEKYSKELKGEFDILFEKMDEQLSPELAERIKKWLRATCDELGFLANVELQLGLKEWALE